VSDANRTDDDDLKARGVSRDPDERNLMVSFNRRPTDNEMRWLHDHLRKGIPHRFQTSRPGCDDCDYDPCVDYSDER
jgi:hypothetical protein